MSGIQIDHLEGRRCSTAVDHMPAEKNSWGRGFESHRVLGFFSSPSIPRQWILNSVPSLRYKTIDFLVKVCLAMQLEAKQAKYARIEQKSIYLDRAWMQLYNACMWNWAQYLQMLSKIALAMSKNCMYMPIKLCKLGPDTSLYVFGSMKNNTDSFLSETSKAICLLLMAFHWLLIPKLPFLEIGILRMFHLKQVRGSEHHRT